MGDGVSEEERSLEELSVEDLSFEEAVAALEEVVQSLEMGEATLERSLELFEQGVRLSRRCMGLLNAAEGRVEQLIRDTDGELRVEPLSPAE